MRKRDTGGPVTEGSAMLPLIIRKSVTGITWIPSMAESAYCRFSAFETTRTAKAEDSEQQPLKRQQEDSLTPSQQSLGSLSSFHSRPCSLHDISHSGDQACAMLEARPITHKKKPNPKMTLYALQATMNILLASNTTRLAGGAWPLGRWPEIAKDIKKISMNYTKSICFLFYM